MTASLEDFRKKIIGTMGWGTGLIWLSFAILFQFLVLIIAQNQRELATSRLSSALNGFVSAHEGKVAIVASNQELKAFLRSGPEGRLQSRTAVLTLLASLRDEFVSGVRLVEGTGSDDILAEIGVSEGQVLAFDLCYIGDQLNAEFGRCAASVLLFIDGKRALERATQSIEQLVPCANCSTNLTDYLVSARFLKISDQTSFPVAITPADAQLGTIQLFFVLISLLVVGLGLSIRFLVGKGIKKDIVDPLSSLLSHMEKGTSVELASSTSVAEVVALHKHNSAFSAIARTTQMLAHDVRKPFSLFRMTLDRVNSAGSPEQVKQALHEALPEVERSLANVNGLISDVLNVGGEFHLVLKPVRLAPLVEDVVDELRKLYPTRSLNVQIKVPSDLWVLADDTRLPRVFLNLLSNAVEAVALNEVQLWVSVSSSPVPAEKKQVEIRVGNSGSFIPDETRAQLFDLFFTSGKKGGTGLGLAIVKKIIEGHGSTVKCESERTEAHPNGQVEFVWSLQSAQALASREAAEPMTLQTSPSSASRTAPSGHSTASCDPVLKTQQAPSPPRPLVAFVDDSPLVRWAWETKLKADVALRVYSGPCEFWQAVNEKSIELSQLHTIITDHYFAPEESLTGLEFAKELREAGFSGRVLLASSGEFKPEAVAGLVDKIVDKQPVSWSELGASP